MALVEFKMAKPMQFVALTAVLCCFLPTTVTATLENWGEVERCPKGEWAIGFTLKKIQGVSVADTALNGISLKCSGSTWIYSAQGPYGRWGRNFYCPTGSWLTSCKLRATLKKGTHGDEMAAFDLDCKCSNGEILEGDGISWGDWNEWSDTCDNGIIGIQTRVDGIQEDRYETPLNDVKFTCWEKEDDK